MAIQGRDITLKGPDGEFSAYGVMPAGATAGVVVIQEIFGVNHHIRSVTERIAAAGYAALAPDIFHAQQAGVQLGYNEQDVQTGFGLMQGLDMDAAVQDIGVCIDFLRDQTGDKVGVTGFCMGGRLTYLAAANLSPDAVAAYYGGGIASQLDQAASISCPILFHFGERDAHIPMNDVEKIRAAVSGLADATVHTYDADHGFHCDERGSYDADAAKLAWSRTLAFFEQHLGR
ncbi:MAG: dienelactone hydrolase family protein [Pseudomonadota bacterium]|nr:dienelactone hydrolase family protein [Pseudomonadota bacterium]